MDENTKMLNNNIPMEDNEEEANLEGSEEKPTERKYVLLGIIIFITKMVCIASSATCVALLERKIPDLELNGARYVCGLVMCTVVFIYKREWPAIPSSNILNVFAVNVSSVLVTTCIFVGVTLVPMSYFKSIYMTCIIFSGLALYPLCLDEKIHWRKAAFSILCLAGVILSVQPPFIFTWKKHKHNEINSYYQNTTMYGNFSGQNYTLETSSDDYTVTPLMTIIGCVLAVSYGILITFYVIFLKKIPELLENLFLVPFYTNLFGTVASFAASFIFEKLVLPSSWAQFGLIALHCVLFIFSSPLIVFAARYVSGNVLNILRCTLVVLMLIPQYTLLVHILPGNHNWIEVFGSFLVFLGASGASILELIWKK